MPDIVLDDFNGFYFPGIQLFGQLQDAGRIDVFEPVGQFIQGAGSRFIAESMQAAEMLAADGINAKVINIHTIKPLDEELVVASAKECKKVVTVEEHSIIGGLGSAVCDTLCANYPTPVLKIGVNDVYGESGPAVQLVKKYGLDAESIYKKVKAFLA